MKIKKEMALPTCAAFTVLLFCLLLLSRCTPNRHTSSASASYAHEAAVQEEMISWYASF